MNSKIVLALFVGVLLGAAFGYVLAPTDVDGSPFARVSAEEPELARGSDTVTAPPPESEPMIPSARRPTPVVDGKLAPVVPSSTIAAAVDRADASASFVATGTGAITGRIIDVDGGPVPGVGVYTSSSGAPRSSGARGANLGNPRPSALLSVGETLDAAAESWAKAKASRSMAVSGADGTFELTGLDGDGRFRVHGYHEEFVVDRSDSSLLSGAEIELVARRIVPVEISVVDAEGSPVSRAELCVWGKPDTAVIAWSSTEASIDLLEGPTRIRAAVGAQGLSSWEMNELDEHCLAASPSSNVDVRPGVERVVLQLAVAEALVVHLAPQEPLPADFSSSLSLGDVGADLRFGQTSSNRVDANDAFVTFGSLAAGRYQLVLGSRHRGAPLAEMEVDYGGGAQDVVLEIPALDRSEPLRVRVLDARGGVVEDASFRYQVRSDSGSSSSTMRGNLGGDGWWVLAARSPYFVRGASSILNEDETARLEISSEEHGEVEVDLVEGRFEYEAQFDPVATLTVTVSGWDPREDAGGRVSVRAASEDGVDAFLYSGFGRNGKTPSAEGTCSFVGLSLGRYVATLNIEAAEVARAEFDLVEGENEVVLVPLPRYSVVVHCPYMTEGTRLYLFLPDDGGNWFNSLDATIDDTLHARFENVVAGTYTLRAGDHTQEIEVPCGTVTVEARPPNAIRVSVYMDDGPLAEIGFENGDLIVGLDGVLFEDLSTAAAALMELGQSEMTLLIDRDGERSDLVTASIGRRLSTGGNLGGTFEYVSRD